MFWNVDRVFKIRLLNLALSKDAVITVVNSSIWRSYHIIYTVCQVVVSIHNDFMLTINIFVVTYDFVEQSRTACNH